MPIIDDQVWIDRIDSGNIYYKKWDEKFECSTLEKYYEGFQWKGQKPSDDRYVINKIFETVQIKLDSFIPAQLKFLVSAAAQSMDYDIETATHSANLKEDTLNTLTQNPDAVFTEELGMAYKDSFFRFGIMEVGYSADWIQNPNAPKPPLNSDVDKSISGPPKIFKKIPQELPVNERVFFKHIPASTFRVGGIDHKYLQRCGWCGYYEWVDRNDLMAIPGLLNKKKLSQSTGMTYNDQIAAGDKTTYKENNNDNIKIWHLWDMKNKLQTIFVDGVCTISEKGFKRLPLFDYRPDKSLITNGFYPIPPVHHWISPQNEINEIREQLKNHRRRFNRKFQVMVGAVDDAEIEKFETGQDGALITVKRENAISAIQSSSLGVEGDKSAVLSSDDLNQISGTSAEVRGVADRTTATQANIISQKSQTRENAERERIVKWLARIGRETLLVARDRFTLGIWAAVESDNKESFLGEVQENLPSYKWVTTEDLNDGYDFRIIVDVTTLSAASQEQEEKKLLKFLSYTTQFPQVAMSPILIREVAYRVGYRNDKVIKELQKMALLHQAAIMQQIQQPNTGNAGQQVVQQGQGDQMTQIQNQLKGQLVQ